MTETLPLIIIAFIFGITFFISHYYEHKHHIFPTSLIAGISVTYFFLVVLPEISERLPEYPLGLTLFEYLFVLIGFVFIHVSEKFIFQKVESKSQEKLRKLIRMENNLESVEDNIENIINRELMHEELDKYALKDLSRVITDLHEQGKSIQFQIEQLKVKIHDHINEDIEGLRFFTNFTYHFLVGIILISLILVELIPAILFYIFAFFRAILSNRSLGKYVIFTDLDIEIDYEETKIRKILLSSAALLGILIGLNLDLFLDINFELLYILFSFISGVILYTIVREIMPEKEKGNPLFFLLGIIGSLIIILILNTFHLLVLINI